MSYRLEDGTTAQIGEQVFNYYDREVVTITKDSGEGWFDTVAEESGARRLLDGSRTCSLGFARSKGWIR